MLKVLDERGRSLVGLLALALDAAGQTAVLIPTLMEELHEAYAFLDESAGLQAICRKGSGRLHTLAIHREGLGGFL